jgi:hypothetical protein
LSHIGQFKYIDFHPKLFKVNDLQFGGYEMRGYLAAVALIFHASAASAQPAETAPPVSTRVIAAPNCLVTYDPPPPGAKAFLPGVLAILAPIVVDFAIKAVSAELKKVPVPKKSAGSVDFDLFAASIKAASFPQLEFPQCFTILTGRFADSQSRKLSSVESRTGVRPGSDRSVLTQRLSDNGIEGGDQLLSILEVQVEMSQDRTGYRYVPVYYRLFELLPGQSAKKQGVAYTLSLLGPGPTSNGTTYSAANVTIGEVSAPMELHRDMQDSKLLKRLAALRTGWLSMPELSTPAYRAFQRWRSSNNAQDTATFALMPVTWQAELVQTRKPSQIALLVAQMLDGAKDSIVAKVKEETAVPDAFAESQALLDARIAVSTAELELAQASAATDLPPDQKQMKISAAQLKKQKAVAALRELEGH